MNKMNKFGDGDWIGSDENRLKQEIDLELKTLRDIDENPSMYELKGHKYNDNRVGFHLLNDIRKEAHKWYDTITSFPNEKEKYLAEWIKQFFNLEDENDQE